MNPGRVIEGYSEEFEQDFLQHLKQTNQGNRVSAKVVYNEFINDRHHIHMNSTKWLSLTEFVKYLGRTGKCKVDETPKGWFISLIQKDPLKELDDEKRIRRATAEKRDEERHLALLKMQVERARRERAEAGLDEEEDSDDAWDEDGDEEDEENEDRKRDGKEEGEEPKEILDRNDTLSNSKNYDRSRKKQKLNEFHREGGDQPITLNLNLHTLSANAANMTAVPSAVTALKKPVAIFGVDEEDEEEDEEEKRGKSKEKLKGGERERDRERAGGKQRDADRENGRERDGKRDMERDRDNHQSYSSSRDGKRHRDDGDRASPPLSSSRWDKSPAPPSSSISSSPASAPSALRSDTWLSEGLVVKILSKELESAGYYKAKGVVLKVVDRYVAEIEVISTPSGDGQGDVLRVDQRQLETVLPAPGGLCRVVNARYRGLKAEMIRVDVDRFQAQIQIQEGTYRGDRVWLEYEDVCKVL